MKPVTGILPEVINKFGVKTQSAGSIFEQPPPKCKLCDDRGLVLQGDTAYPCSCVKQQALIRRFKYANISPEMLECTFDNFRLDYYSRDFIDDDYRQLTYYDAALQAMQAAEAFTREFIDNPCGRGLMFTGPVGSGKTFLASAIANALLEAEKDVLFVVVPDLLDEIRSTYQGRDDSLSDLELLDTARKVGLLILDDLGMHNYTDWVRNKLYSIINYRLNNQLRTVITTNMSLAEMEECLGERTVSRIILMCRIYRLMVKKDIRLIKSQDREKVKIIENL